MRPDNCLNSDISDGVICMKCYKEVTFQNKHGKKYANQAYIDSCMSLLSHTLHSSYPNTDLKHGFALSAWNGFGPCHTPPHQQVEGEDVNISYSRELYYLGCSLTSVKEAAIRPITPLISIIKLNNGGIVGSKGNTSCVWQQSKLNMILPNLPSLCNYIIVTCPIAQNSANANSNSGLRAEFHLLQESKDRTYVTTSKTDKPQGTEALSYIAQKSIQAWPEDGDIATDFSMMVVAESDDG